MQYHILKISKCAHVKEIIGFQLIKATEIFLLKVTWTRFIYIQK